MADIYRTAPDYYLRGNRFQLEAEFGPENGALFVKPVAAIPEEVRDATITKVYDQTLNELASGVPPYRYTEPKSRRQEAVYGYLKLINLGGGITESVVGHAVGSHERIGGRFKGRRAANLDSIFVRRFADEIDEYTDLRGMGIGYAEAYTLLDRFEDDLTVTVMNPPELDVQASSALHDRLLALGFIARVGGKTSRANAQTNQVWYEGTTVEELQARLASESPMIENRLSILFKPPANAVQQGLSGHANGGGFVPIKHK